VANEEEHLVEAMGILGEVTDEVGFEFSEIHGSPVPSNR
jgi:hypothetical protein